MWRGARQGAESDGEDEFDEVEEASPTPEPEKSPEVAAPTPEPETSPEEGIVEEEHPEMMEHERTREAEESEVKNNMLTDIFKSTGIIEDEGAPIEGQKKEH